jgi:hypothetical protein
LPIPPQSKGARVVSRHLIDVSPHTPQLPSPSTVNVTVPEFFEAIGPRHISSSPGKPPTIADASNITPTLARPTKSAERMDSYLSASAGNGSGGTEQKQTRNARSTSTASNNSSTSANNPPARSPSASSVTRSSHRQSFAENLRGVPPSPRQRHPSLTQAAVQDLLNHPPSANKHHNPRFAGRDWREITVGELVSESDVRWVDMDSTVEDATMVSYSFVIQNQRIASLHADPAPLCLAISCLSRRSPALFSFAKPLIRDQRSQLSISRTSMPIF